MGSKRFQHRETEQQDYHSKSILQSINVLERYERATAIVDDGTVSPHAGFIQFTGQKAQINLLLIYNLW